MKTKVLVTGGSGFLGYKFIESLKKYGEKIDFIINLRNEDVDVFKNERHILIYNDIVNNFHFSGKIDILFHIASETREEDKMWSTNYGGTINVMKWAIKAGVKKVVYMSSIAVFGKNNRKIISGSSRCVPESTYGKSKLSAEKFVTEICKKNKVQYFILRPSNIIDIDNIHSCHLLQFIKSINMGHFFYFKNPEKVYLNYITVDNVINCMESLIKLESKKKLYVLNTPTNLKNVVQAVSNTLGVKNPKRIIPYNIGKQCGILCDLLQNISNIKIPFNSSRFQEITNERKYIGDFPKSNLISVDSLDFIITMKHLTSKYQMNKRI